MEKAIVVYLNEDPVIFTEDGRVSVLDAIRLVLEVGSPYTVWERLKSENPDILDHCEEYAFKEEGKVPVIDKEGWEKIWMLLPGYLLDMPAAA
jgi:hypothetical protein